MAIGVVQSIVKTGLTAALGSVSSSQTVLAGKYTFLVVNNGSGGSITVTLTDAGDTPYGSAATNPTFTVAAGAIGFIPVPTSLKNPSDGTVTVAFSSTTTITAGLLVMPAL